MITYRHEGLEPFKITVKNAGRVSGHIVRGGRGYYYRPSGTIKTPRLWGESMPTVEDVKQSLED